MTSAIVAPTPSTKLRPVTVASWSFLLFNEGTGLRVASILRRKLPFRFEVSGASTPNILTLIAPADAGPALEKALENHAVPATWEPPICKDIEDHPRFVIALSYDHGRERHKLPIPIHCRDLALHPQAPQRWIAWALKYYGLRPESVVCVVYAPTPMGLWQWSASKGLVQHKPSTTLLREIRELAAAYPTPTVAA